MAYVLNYFTDQINENTSELDKIPIATQRLLV